jgi:hypothetical protein
MSVEELSESMEQQLLSLYEEREALQQRFGVSSAEDIVNMIECLEAQLHDFYSRFGGQETFGDTESAILLSRLKELSSALDPMYSSKSVQFYIENDKPVLRAEWSESLQEGAAQ